MTIVAKKNSPGPIVIDLSGPNGNAFYLIATVKKLAKQLGLDKADVARITTDMISSDYDNLCKVFTDNFGDYVELVND